MGQDVTLTAEDVFTLSAYRANPAGTPRGGLVVIQEIFGVNHHIRNVTDHFAADGYVSLAPAIFDRVEPGVSIGYTQSDIERGRALRGKLGFDSMMMDVRSAVRALRTEGMKVGVVGYCLGGSLAWLSATRVDGVAAAIGYYGGAVAEFATEQPKCPVLIHWGETDASIPPEHWAKLKAAHAEVPQHVYPAGHGFSCDERGSYHEPSARLARERTIAFLRQHVG